jgi:hypothetical protein
MEFSGPAWCVRYPTSTSIDDLTPAFASDLRAFLWAIEDAEAIVTISATYRPPERAYLMHWCGMIYLSKQDPEFIPPFAGVGIDWTCGGNAAAAHAAAAEMFATYHIRYPAALVSRHTQRRAIDMTIVLPHLPVRLPSGSTVSIVTNEDLYKIGASYGVVKLITDPPHWSDDGH